MKLRVTIDGQPYEVELGDLHARPILATVEGETFEVWPEEDEASHPAPQKPAGEAGQVKASAAGEALEASSTIPAGASAGPGVVLAPIPGVILSVSVKEGDTVSFGQELCVLEAMKMKNQIRATRLGVIAAVHVSAGDQVKHGQVLMEYAR